MAKCKGCGRTIEFVKSEQSGKMIPLEQVWAYEIVVALVAPDTMEARARQLKEKVWVSHFLTCRKADQFSGGKREEAEKAGFPESGEELPG
jgi:hypothetical protein